MIMHQARPVAYLGFGYLPQTPGPGFKQATEFLYSAVIAN